MMEALSIKDVETAINGNIINEGSFGEVTGVSTDTRTLKPGDLFVPLVGEKYDGHEFINLAIKNGAVAILTQEAKVQVPNETSLIQTGSTLKALQDLAAWYLRQFKIPVVAITGSTGKTTTKDMIYSILAEKYKVLKTEGNFNNHIGLPLTLFNLDSSHDIAVLEMGMSGFGEINTLVNIAPPKVAVITNIGISHIEKLGSRDNILKAKLEILNEFDDNCTVVLNNDDVLLSKVASQIKFNTVKYGIQNSAEFKAVNIQVNDEKGLKYDLCINDEIHEIKLNVPGFHNIYNSLCAIAVGRLFNVSIDSIKSGLLKFRSGDMRQNIFGIEPDIKVVDDAYNSSPDSVKAALGILKSMSATRRIAILGDMLELGDYSEKAHRQVGEMVAINGINILIIKGKKSSWIGDGAKDAGMAPDFIYYFNSNEEVIEWLRNFMLEGDRILIKGSRGMHMEEIVTFLKKGRIVE